MSVVHSNELGKSTSRNSQSSESVDQVAIELAQLSQRLREFVSDGVAQGESFDSIERGVWEMVRRAGFCSMELFVKLQGTGDLGERVVTDDQQTLQRSRQPSHTVVRSIFGEHSFEQFTYSRGKNKKTLLYPISARLQLPLQRWSYLLQEFSQMFCVDQAFNQASANLESVFVRTFLDRYPGTDEPANGNRGGSVSR